MNSVVFLILCAAMAVIAGLSVAPLRFDIFGKNRLRLRVRYLCFNVNITGLLRSALRRLLAQADHPLTLAVRLLRRLHITRFRLDVTISGGDAAETALATKMLQGLVCCCLNLLERRRAACKHEITIAPRFLSRQEVCFDCDISFSLPVAVFLYRITAIKTESPAAGKAGPFFDGLGSVGPQITLIAQIMKKRQGFWDKQTRKL
jgi:hypothetical protein